MKLHGILNGNTLIAANSLASLMKKASLIANNRNEKYDTMLVEGLDGKQNRPVLFTRFNKQIGNRKTNSLWTRT